jgi:RNA polymerase sigma factor (sigma-70 family)
VTASTLDCVAGDPLDLAVEELAELSLGYWLAAEPDAIDECYATLSPLVLGYLRRLLPHHEAEDALQLTFYEVWRCRDRYDPARSLPAWVLAIARRRAIDELRRRHRNTVPLTETVEIAGEDGREQWERHGRAAQLRAAMERLPREQYEVLALAYFADLSQAEIAAQLAVPLGTVKARTFRGLRRLATLLAEDTHG